MTGTALALVLASAAVHALWNRIVADVEDPHATTALALLAGAMLFAPLAIATWHLESAALPFLAGSIALELAYLVLLAAAYARADLTFVYPAARGSAPVVVLFVSVVFLGAAPGVVQVAGVLAVALGRERPGTARLAGAAAVVAGAAAIALG